MTVEGQLLEARPSAAICLALADAANNCINNYDARCTLTLRNGAQFTGRLDKDPDGFFTNAHMKNDYKGWITVDSLEIVAVEVYLRTQRGTS